MEFNSEKNTFKPFISCDQMINEGISRMVFTKHMTISMMERFKDKSFEELHLENYNARKSSFGNNNEDNENNQFDVIKDLAEELVNTLCKILLKVNQTASNNLTPSKTNETQSSSFPSESIKITPSHFHLPKFDPCVEFPSAFSTTTTTTTDSMITEPSTNVTNSWNCNCAPSTNNVFFTPTSKPFSNIPMVNPTSIPTTSFGPVQSNKDLFPLGKTNSNTSTTSTWSSSPFTKPVFAPKQSIFNKPTTTEKKSSTSKKDFKSFKPLGFISNPSTTGLNPFTPTSKQPTSSNHNCWYNSPVDNPFTKSTTTPAAVNSFPSSNFNNNAKTSANSFNSNLNLENQNSLLTRSSPPFSSLPLTNSIYIPKPLRINKSKEIGEKKELVDDEFVTSIINCTETLENIASKDHKLKIIGICEKYNTHKTNILKSTFVQLQVMKSRFKSSKKFAFINESAGFLNATVKDNILCGNTYNPERYYSTIALCCLKKDIDSFPHRDLTKVGEIGIKLSDAQRQKIALARAYYANKDVYFLHNSFDKIDSKDARFIFETLILGALKEKVIILMDDHPTHLGHCDTIYILNKGIIVKEDHHKFLLKNDAFYASLFKKDDPSVVTENKAINDQSSDKANKKPTALAPSANHDTFEIININKDIPDVQEKSNENDNSESKKGTQKEVDDGRENVFMHRLHPKYLEADKRNDLNDIDFSKIQNENQISNSEIKTPDQRDDKQEQQLDESAKDETDKKSINAENDEIENDFEIW